MKILVNEEDLILIEELISEGKILKEDLKRWFKEKWVDVSKKVNGKHPPCGRQDTSKGGYPKCRPLKKVSKETPKLANSYDKKEKEKLVNKKRRAEKKNPKIGKGNKPTFTGDIKENEINESQVISLNMEKRTINENNTNILYLNENKISDGIKYHVNNNLPLTENVFRIYSKEYFNLLNESRKLYTKGVLNLTNDDIELLKTDIGKKGIYEGKEVYLDIPFIDEDDFLTEAKHHGKNVHLNRPFRTPGGPKKFAVYVKTPKGTIKKVTFGDPNLKVRNNNPKAAKSFRARHKCDQKKDRTKAGYWSCNVSRYRKSLGIKSSRPW